MTSNPIDKSLFLDFASTILNLSDAFKNSVTNTLSIQVLKKGTHLVEIGEESDYIYFIRKGILRSYVNFNNKEITLWLNAAGEIVATGESILEVSRANESIEALEDCELERISKVEFQELVKTHYEMVILINTILLYSYQGACFRAFVSKIPGAKERYQYFLDSKYGGLITKIPLKYIASFLGLRNETLSRIRASHK